MNWKEVGEWLKGNAGQGAALVGSLLTGNVPAAVATAVSLVASATGSVDPAQSLKTLQGDPQAVVRLQELAYQNEASIREHIRAIEDAKLQDAQAEHHEIQETIRQGDRAEDPFVRRTRPGQSWVSLFGALTYVFVSPEPDVWILGALLTLPLAYAGLRTGDKGIFAFAVRKKK